MQQQIVAIHGGTSFNSYEEYLQFLRTRELSRERLSAGQDWKANLGADLGEGFEVFVPKMPNGANAKYLEWQIWFERIGEVLNDNVILIGHSLGGIFLAKYLSENTFPKSIAATILVAAPFADTSTEESLTEFALPASLDRFAKQSQRIVLFHSNDDPVVPVAEARRYEEAVPHAELKLLHGQQHINQEHFPELVALLQNR